MTFTDDDLGRLKQALEIIGDTQKTFSADFQIAALIARLEAAERIRNLHVGDDPCTCTACIAWRKAAGK